MAKKLSISKFIPLLLTTSLFLSAYDKRSSEPFISGDTFRSFANHVYDNRPSIDPKNVKYGEIIFVKADWNYLEKFFREYHPEIAAPYVLVTQNSDASVPGPFAPYLDDPKLLGWFGQNLSNEKHPKLHPIPIGIANNQYKHGAPHIFREKIQSYEKCHRPILCYLNFHDQNYKSERNLVRGIFSKYKWCHVSPPKRLTHYLQDLLESKFVLSPRGNGLDTHRTWESLLMGAIPIVKSSSLDPLFEDLPVLIIDDWNEINDRFLEEQYSIIKSKPVNREKLFIHYWLRKMREL